VTVTYDVVRTHLEYRGGEVDPGKAPPGTEVVALGCLAADRFLNLYREVGRAYHWMDRAAWGRQDALAHLSDAAVAVFVLQAGERDAGYVEFQDEPDGALRIRYFGLALEFHGRGLGRYFLAWAIAHSQRNGIRALRLHTCTLDSPAALPNYLARGFVVVRQERFTETYSPDCQHCTAIPAGMDPR
jgi:GNAT superfamily N-acetyltransferase